MNLFLLDGGETTSIDFSDLAWGEYAFSRDFVGGKIPRESKTEIIEKSYECGKQQASLLIETAGRLTPQEYIRKFSLRLTESRSSGNTYDRYLLAQFHPPGEIAVYPENLAQISEFTAGGEIFAGLQHTDPAGVVLAHELYHYLEFTRKTLYTTVVKVPLRRLFGRTIHSTLIAPSEIAAASFAREILSLPFNPFVYDAVLTYSKDRDKGLRLIHTLMSWER